MTEQTDAAEVEALYDEVVRALFALDDSCAHNLKPLLDLIAAREAAAEARGAQAALLEAAEDVFGIPGPSAGSPIYRTEVAVWLTARAAAAAAGGGA